MGLPMYERRAKDRLKTIVDADRGDVPKIVFTYPFIVDFSSNDTTTVGCLAASLLRGKPPETEVAFRIDGWTFAATAFAMEDGSPSISVYETRDMERVKGEKGIVLLEDETEVHAASWRRQRLARTALNLAAACVRNTVLEDLHAGRNPWSLSASGDGTDVVITGPKGTMTLERTGRPFDDVAMKELMKKVTGRLYTYLLLLEETGGKGLVARMTADEWSKGYTREWDAPVLDEEWLSGMMTGMVLRGAGGPPSDVVEGLAGRDVGDVEPMALGDRA